MTEQRVDLLALADACELQRLREYARRVSIVLMRWSGGGSEMFQKIGAEYYAQPDLCEQRARHREATIERIRSKRAALHACPAQGEPI